MIRGRYNASRNIESAESVVREFPDPSTTTPEAWLHQAVAKLHAGSQPAVFVLLTGAADLVGFRLRIAQSHARADMLPSCYDHAALLCVDARGALSAYHVPIRELYPSACARTNGIRREQQVAALAPKWRHTPNLALMRFPVESAGEVETAAQDLIHSRLSDDFLSPLSAWLAFVWGVRGSHNPLHDSVSIPSAAFVETCFATARQDVTPGVTTRVVTPESIWQARFWSDQYREPVTGEASDAQMVGTTLGYCVLMQPAACVTWPRSDRQLNR